MGLLAASAVVFLAVLGVQLVWDGAPRGLAGRLGQPSGERPRPVAVRARSLAGRLFRRRETPEQLARLAEALARGTGAGLSIPAALEQAVRQAAPPLRGEVERVLGDYHLGISLSGALRTWQRRASSPDVDLLVETLELARQVGGAVSGPLAQVAATLERRWRDRQEARTQMAEARLSAAVVAAVPPLVAGVTARSGGEVWQVMTGTAAGQLALAVAAVLWCAGVVLALYLVRPPRP